jgi:hypothetical protein
MVLEDHIHLFPPSLLTGVGNDKTVPGRNFKQGSLYELYSNELAEPIRRCT